MEEKPIDSLHKQKHKKYTYTYQKYNVFSSVFYNWIEATCVNTLIDSQLSFIKILLFPPYVHAYVRVLLNDEYYKLQLQTILMQILQNTPVPHFYKFGKRIKVLNMQIKAGVSQYLHNITNMYFYNILHIIFNMEAFPARYVNVL